MSKKVLITGTSSGFGRLIAGTMLQDGHTVVASMRDVDGRGNGRRWRDRCSDQQLTSGIYNAFGMADMLTLKT